MYCARPGRDLAQVVGEGGLQPGERVGPLDTHGAEVAHVEHDRVTAAGQVLLDRAARVRQRHLPAAEGHQLRPEGHVPVVERRAAQFVAHGLSDRDGGPGCRDRRGLRAAARAQLDGPVDLGLHAGQGQHVEHALAAPQHVDQFLAGAQHDLVALDDEMGRGDVGLHVVAQEVEHDADRLELDAGVEQVLDDLQLEQVAVGVPAPATRCRWRR